MFFLRWKRVYSILLRWRAEYNEVRNERLTETRENRIDRFSQWIHRNNRLFFVSSKYLKTNTGEHRKKLNRNIRVWNGALFFVCQVIYFGESFFIRLGFVKGLTHSNSFHSVCPATFPFCIILFFLWTVFTCLFAAVVFRGNTLN